jgi:TolA-binding protein
MKRLFIVFTFLLIASSAFAQSDKIPGSERADRVAAKVHELELLNQILPVLFTKDQLGKILPIIEKSRKAKRQLQIDEQKVMMTLEKELDDAIKEAYAKKKVPTTEITSKVFGTYKNMSTARQVLVGSFVEQIFDVMKAECDEGQRKAAALALQDYVLTDLEKKMELTEENRLRIWIRIVLMNHDAYDVLVKLYKAG